MSATTTRRHPSKRDDRRPPTYVVLYVRDPRAGVERSYVLGELDEVYAQPVLVGRDPSCAIILDADGVLPRHAELTAASNHRFVRMLAGPEPRARHDGSGIRIGPFELALSEQTSPRDYGPGPALPVRFGAERGLGAVRPAEIPRDPRRTELAQLLEALANPSRHARRLDGETERWCEAQVAAHFDELSRATAPLPPLAPGRIEYASSLAEAAARWRRAWGAIEASPFEPGLWAYVHRVDRWSRERDRALQPDRWDTAQYLRPFERDFERLLGGSERDLGGSERDLAQERDAMTGAVRALLYTHLVTLDDAHAPARPLVALLARGVVAFALPGGAMLLYLASAGEVIARVPDEVEAALLRALALAPADRAARAVYADHLEQRGDVLRAAIVRAELSAAMPPPPPMIARVEALFGGARCVLLQRDGAVPEPAAALLPGDAPPPAWIELGGYRYPLAAVTGIAYQHPVLRVEDVSHRASFEPTVIIAYANGVLWASPSANSSSQLNGRLLLPISRRWPLYDRDVLQVDGRTLIVRIEGR